MNIPKNGEVILIDEYDGIAVRGKLGPIAFARAARRDYDADDVRQAMSVGFGHDRYRWCPAEFRGMKQDYDLVIERVVPGGSTRGSFWVTWARWPV